MSYSFYTTRQSVPQSQPTPGREEEMVEMRSGGYSFSIDEWTHLRRCLIMGTASGSYYAGKRELTEEFINTLKASIALNPYRVADEIFYASDGRSINNSAPILALVLLSMGESKEAKKAFKRIFPEVVRTASHFYEWLSYTKSMRGMGRVIQEVGIGWLSLREAKALAYQLLKYQQRHGYSARDALRLFHVRPPSEEHNQLFSWVVKGWDEFPTTPPSKAMEQIWWWEWLKANPERAVKAIEEGGLTHEMAAPIGKMDVHAWQALFNGMPIGALLRNLSSLTEIGVLGVGKKANLDRVEEVLNSKEYLRKGRIHPIDILKALKTYQSGGSIGMSKKTWAVLPRVVDILEKALELSFDALEPTGLTYFHAIDISGSMRGTVARGLEIRCSEIAAVMCLASVKAEKNYFIGGFSRDFIPLDITRNDSFVSASHKVISNTFGPTDASIAYSYAIRQGIVADVFCFWTDGESWAGKEHPHVALARYREKVNPRARAIYTALAPNAHSLGDPKDSNSFNLSGFDPSMPTLIQMIGKGEI
jgi:60 kDa SS-A/Ro ribonucleoprotein